MGDFGTYIYKTSDYGQTWKSIVGNVPQSVHSFAHVVIEDPKTFVIETLVEPSPGLQGCITSCFTGRLLQNSGTRRRQCGSKVANKTAVLELVN